MSHILLTGATGLLGRYLMKDLLTRGVKLAVLVRPSRKFNPHTRVEAAMRVWEEQLGRELPRPVVLAGDINSPDMGLNANEIKWAAENCDSMIHNAASLSFVSTGPESEPWRSNVGGTANVLEFCQQAGIDTFHHVSTAYVAGMREGKVLESELDEGQEYANPYEESKVQAETMVRESGIFKDLTVFRPAIIVGDSESGLTFTYHNFYVMLQLSQTLSMSIGEVDPITGKINGSDINININGNERKNLVPVDWVSEVMASVVTDKNLHGQTYHLTPRVPITTRLILDVLEEVNGFYGIGVTGSHERERTSEIEEMFYQHMEVYHSYWKDDAEFDSTNTVTALPHLPCPHIDREMLTRLSKVAIDRRFNWRDPKIESVEIPVLN